MKSKEFTIENKILKSLLIVCILPVILILLLGYFNISKLQESNFDDHIGNNLDVVTKLMDRTLINFNSITNYIATNEEIAKVMKVQDYSSSEEKFKDVQKIYTIISSVLATEELDVPVHIIDVQRNTRFSTTDYYKPIYQDSRGDFLQSLEESEVGIRYHIHRRVDGKFNRDVVLSLGKKIVDPETKETLGYVICDIYDNYFQEIMDKTNPYKGENIFIVDKLGYIVTDKNAKHLTGFTYDHKLSHDMRVSLKGEIDTGKDKDYKIYYNTSEVFGFKVIENIPKAIASKEQNTTKVLILILLIFMVVILILVSKYMSNNLSVPINFLIQQSEFKALKAQVNPHFLYNTLESINWMAKLGENKAVSEMVTALGKFLRYNISSKSDVVSIKEELEQIKRYLKIQSIRFKDKFQIQYEIDEEILDKEILRLTLQPLVENAIIHGFEQKVGKGNLLIKGYIEEDNINIEICDDGIGLGNSKVSGESVGIENVNSRIKIVYGEKYGAKVESREGLTCSIIKIPSIDASGGSYDKSINC